MPRPTVDAWLAGVFATLCAMLMLGAIRWGVPAYAEEVAEMVASNAVASHSNGSHKVTADRIQEVEKRMDAVESGIVILLRRSGGPPTDAEIRETKNWLKELRDER